MANKERQKRSARQERAREREALEAAHAVSNATGNAKTPAKAEQSSKTLAKKGDEGIIARTRTYFNDVRTEMHRVVWPSKTELKDYSVAVIASLIIFGVAVWLVDTGFVAIIAGLTSLGVQG